MFTCLFLQGWNGSNMFADQFRKNKLLEQHDQQSQKNDTQLLTEIQSLRAILLAKVGNLKREDTSLYEIVPASNALKELEDQVKQYIQVLGEKVEWDLSQWEYHRLNFCDRVI